MLDFGEERGEGEFGEGEGRAKSYVSKSSAQDVGALCQRFGDGGGEVGCHFEGWIGDVEGCNGGDGGAKGCSFLLFPELPSTLVALFL